MLIVSRALLGVAFRNARALHALPDPQHVYGPRPARPGHRGMGNQLLSGSGDWAARRWGAAGVLLVGSVFLLAVPVMALLLVLGPVLLPAYRDPEAGRLDLITPPAAHRDPQAASPRPSSRYRKPFPAVSDSRISCYRKRRTVSGRDKYGY